MKQIVKKVRSLNRWDWLFLFCMAAIPTICISFLVQLAALSADYKKTTEAFLADAKRQQEVIRNTPTKSECKLLMNNPLCLTKALEETLKAGESNESK